MTTEMNEQEKSELHHRLAREAIEASLRIFYKNGMTSISDMLIVLSIGFVNTVESFGKLIGDKDLLKFVLNGLNENYLEKEEKND